jgi:hypothetical protein
MSHDTAAGWLRGPWIARGALVLCAGGAGCVRAGFDTWSGDAAGAGADTRPLRDGDGGVLTDGAPSADRASAADGAQPADSRWAVVPAPTQSSIRGIFPRAADRAWAVTHSGDVLRFESGGWSHHAAVADNTLNDVWADGLGQAWVVGDGGRAARFDGAVWQPVALGTTADLLAVWGNHAADVWIAGDGGTVLRFDGASWRQVTSGTTARLNGLWGAGERIWAVGDNGVLLAGGADGLAPVAAPSSGNLTAIWGSSATDLWVGVRELYQGDTVFGWTLRASNNQLKRIRAARPTSDVRAVGVGVILRCGYGASCAPVGVPFDLGATVLWALWVTPDGELWIGGQDGTLIHFAPSS